MLTHCVPRLYLKIIQKTRLERVGRVAMNDEQFVRIIYVGVLSALFYGYLWPAVKEAYSKWVQDGCKSPDFFRRKRG